MDEFGSVNFDGVERECEDSADTYHKPAYDVLASEWLYFLELAQNILGAPEGVARIIYEY